MTNSYGFHTPSAHCIAIGVILLFSIVARYFIIKRISCRTWCCTESHVWAFGGQTWQLEHAESKLLIVDCELAGIAKAALAMMEERHRPRLVQAEDSRYPQWQADGEEFRDFLR